MAHASTITRIKDWTGKLPIQSMTIETGGDLVEDSGTVDVCQYIPGGLYHTNIDTSVTKMRFDQSVFPPSESHKTAFDSSNQTYIKLRIELQRAAKQCGYSIVPKSGARFVCKCARTYLNATSGKSRARADTKDTATLDITTANTNKNVYTDNEDDDPLRKQFWQNDGRNTRKKGPVPLRRNTATSLPMELHATCKFAIKLYHDNEGYYVSPKYGYAIHSHHQYIEGTNKGPVSYLRLFNAKVEGNSNTDNLLFYDTDCPTLEIPVQASNYSRNNSMRDNVRSTLTPLFDQICNLYESESARHTDMPTIDSVIDVLNEKICDVNHFFNGLDKEKDKKCNSQRKRKKS